MMRRIMHILCLVTFILLAASVLAAIGGAWQIIPGLPREMWTGSCDC